MVVRVDAGADAVRAYVMDHASRGRDYVVGLIEADHDRVLGLIGDLSEEQAPAVTPADEWAAFDLMRHLTTALNGTRLRIETLASGQEYVQRGSGGPGSLGPEYGSFAEVRAAYADGMAAVLDVLRAADETRELDLTADHRLFGPFNWLQWAVYMYHVHTHDHLAQLERIIEELGEG